MSTYEQREAVAYQGNRFGFVYGGAIEDNLADAVNVEPIRYEMFGTMVAANVYLPADYDASGSVPGVVVAHPNGAVKEQAAGLYAQRLAERGFVALAFDAYTTGESGGEPRNRDIPYFRVEDMRRAADVLSTFPGVDADRLHLLGICGGSGYALAAATQDKRFKTVATVSLFNTGSVRREGFCKSQKDTVLERLHASSDLRAKEAAGGEWAYSGDMTDIAPEVGHAMAFDMYREGYEYYAETHFHPSAHARFAQRDLTDLMCWDPEPFLYLLDQPLLLVVGEKADTAYMSESAYEAAGSAQKDIFTIAGATHVDLYHVPEYVNVAVDRIADHFHLS